jgi:hypothetical protein
VKDIPLYDQTDKQINDNFKASLTSEAFYLCPNLNTIC